MPMSRTVWRVAAAIIHRVSPYTGPIPLSQIQLGVWRSTVSSQRGCKRIYGS